MLFGALLLLVALVVLLGAWPRARPELVQVEEQPEAQVARLEQVPLVGYEFGPNGEWLERLSFAEVPASEVASTRYRRVLEALQEALGAAWPEGLAQPEVIVVAAPNGAETAVLDFTEPDDLGLDVLEEEALLKALRETLRRNGAAAVRILVDHRPSATFLGHLELEQGLE